MRCFETRNFGIDALANRIMGTRFDVEVAKKFHPELVKSAWVSPTKVEPTSDVRARTLARLRKLEKPEPPAEPDACVLPNPDE